jgi:hypothetical protein
METTLFMPFRFASSLLHDLPTQEMTGGASEWRFNMFGAASRLDHHPCDAEFFEQVFVHAMEARIEQLVGG